MRDVKRRPASFSFLDHTHAERYLERMAQKGWMLEKIGDFSYTYRRAEPKKLRFSICYASNASAYEPELTDEQKEFIDFCERTGWRFVASNAKMQVFCNERQDPVPIYTDPVSELASLHKAARGYLCLCAILVALSLWQLLTQLGELRYDPVETLANVGALMILGAYAWLLVQFGVELAAYFLWQRRALRAAERGEFLPTPNLMRFNRVMGVLLSVQIVFWALYFAFFGSRRVVTAGLAAAAYYLVVVLGARLARDLLKRKGVSYENNLAATIAVSIVLAIGGMVLLNDFLSRAPDAAPDDARSAAPRLAMSALFDVDDENYYYGGSDSASPLLACSDRHCGVLQDTAMLPEGYQYTAVDVRALFLRDYCRDALMRRQGRSASEMWVERHLHRSYGLPERGEFVAYQSVDPAPWGADEAWRFQPGVNHWLLRYGERFVAINLTWEPTAAQTAIIGETLGGG